VIKHQCEVDTTVPASTPLLRTEDLKKSYGGVHAIQGISFELHKGDVCGVIGPNGAGKSTFIGLLGGALSPSGGRIYFEGNDVTRLQAPYRASLGIGRTYQVPRPFLNMSVMENLLTAQFALHPLIGAGEAKAFCEEILERTGLLEQKDWLAKDLPLLRRKRLEIARALAIRPRLLLLDEVGAGLIDSEVSELIELILSLKDKVDSIIIIEHVLRVVRECCNRTLVINFGKKIAEGPTSDVLASREVAEIYLGNAANRHSQSVTESPQEQKTTSPVGVVPQAVLDDAECLKPSEPLLELLQVHAGYGQAKVLQGVSLKVFPGSTVAILGTNGAGKSTLANVISGVLRPTAGQFRIDGKDAGLSLPYERSRLGIAQCQEGRKIFPNLTVEENLLISTRGLTRNQRLDRLDGIYTLFPDLHKRRHDGGTAMSGGQQQMLAIGRALMARPRLIVFDEISLGLAPVMMDRLYMALMELKKSGLTLVIVEQDVARALELADEVHVLEHGKIALTGDARSVKHDPRLKSLYIGEAIA
jgi:branched-chain amino acid transport system ATP-binding protein